MSTKPATARPWSEEQTLLPELRALLVCARAVLGLDGAGSLDEALSGCPAVERVCEAAVRHGMLGHLHRLVTTTAALEVDPALSRRLAELQRALAVRNLRQTSFLVHALDQLAAAGVRALPFKGPVLAQALYGDITLRSWADVDLLVSHEQVATARDVLYAAGLRDSSGFTERSVRPRWGDTGQIALVSAELGQVVDLHWKLGVSASPRTLRPEAVFANAETIELLGRTVMCPGTTAMFLTTCLEGTRDRWNSVSRLLDLAVQIQRTPRQEWAAVLATAKGAGCRRRCLVGVCHVGRVLGLVTPQPVADALASDRQSRILIGSLQPQGLVAAIPEGLRGRVGLLRWQAAGEDSRLDGLRYLLARLLAPTAEDWERFALSSQKEWVYYLLRPGRLAVKWCKHLARSARKAQHLR